MIKNIVKLIVIFVLQIAITGCSKSEDQKTENKANTISTIKTEGNKSVSKNIYDISVKNMDGETVKLADYKGKVLLIVNVASKCGYTPQYGGLEQIYEKYKDRGFEILAFPSNDFGGQEPGTNDEIRTFCESKYNVTFPLFDKVAVTGDGKCSLYERLTSNPDFPGEIAWNFEKFLIDKNGDIVARYKSKVRPEGGDITSAIETELGK